MGKERTYYKIQPSFQHLPVWALLLVVVLFVYYYFNVKSELYLPITLGYLGGDLAIMIEAWLGKYKLEGNTLSLPRLSFNRDRDLTKLESMELKDNSYFIQLFRGKPPQSIELKFQSSFLNTGKVELWSDDPQLIKQLQQYLPDSSKSHGTV